MFDEKIINICFNYGGRLEIVDTTKKIAKQVLDGKLKIEDITEEVFDDNLYQKLPPVDLVIRTSGEQRISNFLLWEASYAEYYFPKVLFPDFDEKEFDIALEEYENRNRRFGG
jgi:undecaprenyl diphosphate synthase